jgi:hypothetical protein
VKCYLLGVKEMRASIEVGALVAGDTGACSCEAQLHTSHPDAYRGTIHTSHILEM